MGRGRRTHQDYTLDSCSKRRPARFESENGIIKLCIQVLRADEAVCVGQSTCKIRAVEGHFWPRSCRMTFY